MKKREKPLHLDTLEDFPSRPFSHAGKYDHIPKKSGHLDSWTLVFKKYLVKHETEIIFENGGFAVQVSTTSVRPFKLSNLP
jgi:hypothetical protein